MTEPREIRKSVDPRRLRKHVEQLDEPRGRAHAPKAMTRAEEYVRAELASNGWRVTRRQFWFAGTLAANLLAERRRRPDRGRPAYLVGAHLDTVPGSPGADDNASGVACLLELGRILRTDRLDHDVLLAVFDEEETGMVGSTVLAQQLSAERQLAGVVVFECVGYYLTAPRTQSLPPGAGLVYRDQVRRLRKRGMPGDWTLLAYRNDARHLADALGTALTQLAGPDAAVLARDPLDLPGLGRVLRGFPGLARHFARSDHKPFWDRGIPAVQVTDTANFRNRRYHRPSDTPATLNYMRMADIVAATAAAITQLSPTALK